VRHATPPSRSHSNVLSSMEDMVTSFCILYSKLCDTPPAGTHRAGVPNLSTRTLDNLVLLHASACLRLISTFQRIVVFRKGLPLAEAIARFRTNDGTAPVWRGGAN
jgi:hypothetical protein